MKKFICMKNLATISIVKTDSRFKLFLKHILFDVLLEYECVQFFEVGRKILPDICCHITNCLLSHVGSKSRPVEIVWGSIRVLCE